MATMYQCVHFWGWKALEDSSGKSDAIGGDQMTVFQMTFCSILVRRLRGTDLLEVAARWLGC